MLSLEQGYSCAGQARPFSHEDYTVGWICALSLEMIAAKAMFDKLHPDLPNAVDDDNIYTLGQMGVHNIVMTCLPSGVYGTTSAAIVANKIQSTFRSIRFGLMVGIGGGAPSKFADIRLGDVVVSNPTESFGGVVPYDCGKAIQEGVFKRTGTLNKPPQVLLKAVSKLRADKLQSNRILDYLAEAAARDRSMTKEFTFLDPQEDWLFEAQYEHVESESPCDDCDRSRLMTRPVRSSSKPVVHYGLIASGNQVMRNANTRDRLAREYGILCFEMEAAGLMDHFPSLVIRGICDYSDSHKNKKWQAYAAATAAAYAKTILSMVPDTQSTKAFMTTTATLIMDESARKQKADILSWISTFHYRQKYLDLCKQRMKETGQWLLDSSTFQQWLSRDKSPGHLVWCCGDPGTGKSVLAYVSQVARLEFCKSKY
jgi:nucleoside phosphorylase